MRDYNNKQLNGTILTSLGTVADRVQWKLPEARPRIRGLL